MRKIRALDVLLPRTRQGILSATLMQPEKAWYASELARRMRVPPSSLQRELQGLVQAGILRTHRQGRMVYYQANTDSPLFPDLRGLMLKTVGFVDVLADAVRPLVPKMRAAFVHASIAAGKEQADSEIDVMVIGTLSPAELALPLRRAGELLGREINPTVYTPAEVAKKRANKDPFLARVLHKPKLFVVGNNDELERAAG